MTRKVLIGAAGVLILVAGLGLLGMRWLFDVSEGLHRKFIALTCESQVMEQVWEMSEDIKEQGDSYYSSSANKAAARNAIGFLAEEMEHYGFTMEERREILKMPGYKLMVFVTRAQTDAAEICPKRAGPPGREDDPQALKFIKQSSMAATFMQRIAAETVREGE